MFHTARVLPLRAGSAPLFGRHQQRVLVAEQLAETRRAGDGQRVSVVLLAGAPGIGKTRLLDTLTPETTSATVVRGGASQAAGMPPYVPFLEALGGYLATAPLDQIRQQVGINAATLATLFPELPARLGPVPPPHPLGPEQARFRLCEAVASFLAALATPDPLVLVLDDLHWADAATFDLLVHVASRLQSRPVLIVGAYRDGEAARNPALGRALAELNRRRLLLTFAIPPLDHDKARGLRAACCKRRLHQMLLHLCISKAKATLFFLKKCFLRWPNMVR